MLAFFPAIKLTAADSSQDSARKLWDTYMNAGATAVENSDVQDAEVLWKCALQVAAQMRDESRIILSGTTLYIAAIQLKDEKTMSLVKPLPRNLNVSNVDQTLLPVSRTLGRLANWYDDDWSKSKGRGQNDFRLSIAEWCRRQQEAIQKKAMPEPDAGNVALYGLVLRHKGNFDEERNKFEEALSLWDQQNQGMNKRALASNQFCILAKSDPDMEKLSSTLLYVELVLAQDYMEHESKTNEASKDAALKRAEELDRRVLDQLEGIWPRGRDVANAAYQLARLYQAEKKYPGAEARFKQSLELYEKLEGQQSANVAEIAKELATVLTAEHRAQEAQALERKYHITKAAAQ